MYSKTSLVSSRRVGQERRWTSSFLSVAKKLSATALSKQSPLEPIERAMPASRADWPTTQRAQLLELGAGRTSVRTRRSASAWRRQSDVRKSGTPIDNGRAGLRAHGRSAVLAVE